MRITYLGNIKDAYPPTIDKQILSALKKQAEVKFIDIKDPNVFRKTIKEANNSDMLLFHGTFEVYDEITFMLMVERLQVMLDNIKCKKVLWLLNKVWTDYARLLVGILPKTDMAFLSDGTWIKRFDTRNIHFLPPAGTKFKGGAKKEYECDVAFIGKIYSRRKELYEHLKNNFTDKFKVFNNCFEKEMASLCKSAKIIVSPMFPFDDFFWSDRIYTVLANGGFLIHPRAYGLTEQGLKEGEHFIPYTKEDEIVNLIDLFLKSKKERIRIAKKGQEFVLANHTYDKRIKEILCQTKKLNTSESAKA